MKDLAKAMGIEWHDLVINIPRITCSCGVAWQGEFPMGDFMRHRNPSPTDEAFCWKVLTYMMGREDYNEFDKSIWYKYHNEVINWRDGDKPSDYLKWLFSNPARFIGLCDGWCREHEEVKA